MLVTTHALPINVLQGGTRYQDSIRLLDNVNKPGTSLWISAAQPTKERRPVSSLSTSWNVGWNGDPGLKVGLELHNCRKTGDSAVIDPKKRSGW